MKICCIVGAGECNEFDFIKGKDDLLIAADGGYEHLKKFGIRPDMAIGDFDSLGFVPDDIEIIKLPVEKDVTDMKAAVDIGIARGYKTFYIYGGCGGRIDHTISNIQLAASLAGAGIKAFIRDAKNVIVAVRNDKIELDASLKGYISVFAHSDLCEGVSIKGLKYTAENAKFSNTFPLGVSNEFINQKAEISVKNGTLIVVYSY